MVVSRCLRGLLPDNSRIGGSSTLLCVSGLSSVSSAALEWRRGFSRLHFEQPPRQFQFHCSVYLVDNSGSVPCVFYAEEKFKKVWNRSSHSSSFLFSFRRWALSWWGIWALLRFSWCCCWSWQTFCLRPFVGRNTKSGLLQLLQGCSHCEFVADFCRAISFVSLKKTQGSNGESLPELLSPCERSHPGLSLMSCWTYRQRNPLQNGHHSGCDPQSAPGFLCPCFGMFPERFPKWSVPVGSFKKCGTLVCWLPGTAF